MFGWWAHTVVRARWLVLTGALLVGMVGATWGSGVYGKLTTGGFGDPGSESAKVPERVAAELGNQNTDLVALYSSDRVDIDHPAFRGPVTATLGRLRGHPEVANIVTYYDNEQPALVSRDRHATYAVISLRTPDSDGKRRAYETLRPALNAPGVTTRLGGAVAFEAEQVRITERDVARGETISLPILAVLLVFIFGGLVAAGMPLLIGGLAIVTALTTTRLLTAFTDVSTFAVNSITLLGLGMAIDYSLFMVSRFREELDAGRETPRAVARTMATAGRTVLVSGLTIMLALASLLIFPQVFLRSMGLGGIAAVGVAMLGAVTVLPALFAVLGPRVNALRVPLPWRRRDHRAEERPASAEHGAWARVARSVMRRPVLYIAVILPALLALALPFARAEFGGPDERIMPAGAESRVVTERIAADFTGATTDPIETLVTGASAAQVRELTGRIQALRGITEARVTASRGETTLLSVGYEGEPTGDRAHEAVRAIRELPVPAGVDVLVGGRTAIDIDLLDSLGARLPWMAAIMIAVTLVLLFLAFGSVVLPIKAVLMNLVSIGASFGVIVWVFQDGHLSGLLGFTATGFMEASVPVLMLSVLFGLSTDYEVFLLSRVREEWDVTGDNATAVAVGLQRTGGIVTAAALLLITVVIGFTAGGIAYSKLIGVGMLVGIAVDATLVRALLVPATMRLLGRWNWWSPGPLARVYGRYGITESSSAAAAAPIVAR